MSKRVPTPPAWQRLPLSEALVRMPQSEDVFRQRGARDCEDEDSEASEDAYVDFLYKPPTTVAWAHGPALP